MRSAIASEDVRAHAVGRTTSISTSRPSACRLPAIARIAGAFALALSVSGSARAAQTDVVISMAPSPAAVHIVGAGVVGAVPNSPFLYTIAATGQRPMTFSATGLPAGLSIDASTGQITGTAGGAGQSVVTVVAINAGGSDRKTLTIDTSGAVASTPPMGWNSYDSYGATVTESEVLAQARAQLSLLQPVGFRYVVVDYLWFDAPGTIVPDGVIDANGRYLPAISRFPSATGSLGFKPLADQIHAMGLNFGIHIMRGVPRKSVIARSPIAGTTYTTADAANTSDLCPWDAHMYGVNGATAAGQAWYDSIFAQYAQWGIDFVKVDDMIKHDVPPPVYHRAEVDAIRKAIDKTGRSIALSLSPGPMQTADATHLGANATMWRIVDDFWDRNGLSTLANVFTAAGAWQAVGGIGVGHWPDADMLPLGYMEPRCPVSGNHRSALTHNEQVSMMSMWAILPSPLMLGGNVVDLTADATTGPWTTALLTNDEVLAIDQDSLGERGRRVDLSGNQEVWAKNLAGGRTAVALFNHDTMDQPVSVTWAQLGLSGVPLVRDVWRHAPALASPAGLTATVPYGGALLFVVGPSSDGGAPDASVGSSVDSGRAPNGGSNSPDGGLPGASPGSGGDSSTGPDDGSFGNGASRADGTASPVDRGSANATPAGTSTDAGSQAAPGSASPGPDGSAAAGGPQASSRGGCGCLLAEREERGSWPAGAWTAVAMSLGVWSLRRRRARRGEPTVRS